jgi:hypothetical protein
VAGGDHLLRHPVGRNRPLKEILYDGELLAMDPERRQLAMRRFGVMYQNGAPGAR